MKMLTIMPILAPAILHERAVTEKTFCLFEMNTGEGRHRTKSAKTLPKLKKEPQSKAESLSTLSLFYRFGAC